MDFAKMVYDPPLFIEELSFWVNPEQLEKYLRVEEELWVENLKTREGFVYSQLWLGEEGTSEVTKLYFWKRYEDYAGLDQDWLGDLKQRAGQAMGEGNTRFIGAMKDSKKKYLVREYRSV